MSTILQEFDQRGSECLTFADDHGELQADRPIMMLQVPDAQARFFEPRQAQYVIHVLGMLIRVVGENSLLGTILKQTRLEVTSVLAE